jgi:hypothetical protein
MHNLLKSYDLGRLVTLPSYVDYYDYDFRNAQSLRLLEDIT